MNYEFVRHNERCKECKKRVLELPVAIYGEVKERYNLKQNSKLNELGIQSIVHHYGRYTELFKKIVDINRL